MSHIKKMEQKSEIEGKENAEEQNKPIIKRKKKPDFTKMEKQVLSEEAKVHIRLQEVNIDTELGKNNQARKNAWVLITTSVKQVSKVKNSTEEIKKKLTQMKSDTKKKHLCGKGSKLKVGGVRNPEKVSKLISRENKWIGLLPVVVCFALAHQMHLCVQQDFLFMRICQKTHSHKICMQGSNPEMANLLVPVQKIVVRQTLLISIVVGLTSIVSSQLIGGAFDKYSRKLLLLIPYMGCLFTNLICVVISAIPSTSTELLYLANAIHGATGGWLAFKACVSSYAVHECPAEDRSARLGVIEGLVFLGNFLGPFITQMLTTYTTCHDMLFLFNECVAVFAVLYIIFFIPDYSISQPTKLEALPEYDSINAPSVESPHSNTASKNKPYSQSPSLISPSYSATDAKPQSSIDYTHPVSDMRTNIPKPDPCPCFSSFLAALRCTFRRRRYGVRPMIIGLLVADFFIAIVFAAEFDLLYLYLREKLDFSFAKYTDYLAFKNLMNGISLMVLLPFVRRVVGDNGIGLLGGVSRVIAFIGLAFVTKSNLAFLVPVCDIFGSYLFVALRANISILIQEDEQGRVFTVVGTMAQFSLMMGSIFFDNLYNIFLEMQVPGITFLLAAGFMGVSTLILSMLACNLHRVTIQSKTTPVLQELEESTHCKS